jgi:hypothetical protein
MLITNYFLTVGLRRKRKKNSTKTESLVKEKIRYQIKQLKGTPGHIKKSI